MSKPSVKGDIQNTWTRKFLKILQMRKMVCSYLFGKRDSSYSGEEKESLSHIRGDQKCLKGQHIVLPCSHTIPALLLPGNAHEKGAIARKNYHPQNSQLFTFPSFSSSHLITFIYLLPTWSNLP